MKAINKIFIFFLSVIFISSSIIILLPEYSVASQIKLNYGTSAPPNGVDVIFARHFQTLVERMSNGEIQIAIFHSGQLGTTKDLINGTLIGSVDLTSPPSNMLIDMVPKIGILNIPYSFPTLQQLKSHPLMQDIKSQLENQGITILSWIIGPKHSLSVDSEIRNPYELKGMKIGIVPDSCSKSELYTAWGAVPVAVSSSKLYTAFKLGVVNGVDFNPIYWADMKLYELQKYLILTNHMRHTYAFIINNDKFYELSNDNQQILIKCADLASKFIIEWLSLKQSEIEKLKIEGYNIIKPNLSEWISQSKPIQEKLMIKYCPSCIKKWPPECDCNKDDECTDKCDCDPDCVLILDNIKKLT